jgi:hypothetical protein
MWPPDFATANPNNHIMMVFALSARLTSRWVLALDVTTPS